MEVFVIPRGAERYALYCEPSAGADAAVDESSTGLTGRATRYFNIMLRDAEAQAEGETVAVEAGWLTRLQRRLLHWVAERMAEQRFLWRLRNESAVTVLHPPDMTFADVRAVVDRELRRERDRHRLLGILFTAAFVASGVVAVVPGPNVIAYYFAFRMVGHWLSLRGALRGLRHVAWTGRECPELAALRDAIALPPADRDARVKAVAYQLHLPRLPRFVARIAPRAA